MIRFLTAGESHGKSLVAIIEGFPAGVPVTALDINTELKRRQQGYGRGPRQVIENDKVEILSGIRGGKTIGSPIALKINNLDWQNWQDVMSAEREPDRKSMVTRPRPGHADLGGVLKYDLRDIRDVLERASARETAVRTAVGAVCRRLLYELDVDISSHVLEIGGAGWDGFSMGSEHVMDMSSLTEKADRSPVRCIVPEVQDRMISNIDNAREQRDTLGGIFEIVVTGLPPGLGSYVHWDRRLEGRLAGALMSLNGVKAVEFGLGKGAARKPGSEVHDEIRLIDGKICRASNRAGGIEGGMTTGEPLLIRVALKPISTLGRPLISVDLENMSETSAHYERADICAVPAASVIGEAIVSIVLAQAFIEKFGGDSLIEIRSNLDAYLERLGERGWKRG
jgi:chorismate synthase